MVFLGGFLLGVIAGGGLVLMITTYLFVPPIPSPAEDGPRE